MATSLQFAIPGSVAQTYLAGAALTVGQSVQMSALGTVIPCTAAADVFVGVVQSDSAASGEPVSIVVQGLCYALCGATAIPYTTPLVTSATGGTFVPWTSGSSKRVCAKIIGYGSEPGGGTLSTAAGDLRTAVVLGGIIVD